MISARMIYFVLKLMMIIYYLVLYVIDLQQTDKNLYYYIVVSN